MKNFILNQLINLQKKPWIIIAATILVSFLLSPGLSKLKTNYNMRYWLRPDNSLIKELDYFERHFGGENYQHLIKENKRINLKSLIQYKTNISDEELRTFRRQVIEDPHVNGLFVGDQQKTGIIFGRLISGTTINGEYMDGPNYQKLVLELNQIIKRFKEKYPEFEIFLSGSAVLQNDFHEISESDLKKIMPFLIITLFSFLFWVFRSLITIFFPVIILTLTNLMTFSLAGFLEIEIENLVSAVPLILLTCCLGNTIHFCLSFLNGGESDSSQNQTINETLNEQLMPILLTSASTSLGFAGLIFSDLVPIHNLGILGFIGSIIACVLSLTLLPALLVIKPRTPRPAQLQNGQEDASWGDTIYFFTKKRQKPIIIFFTIMSFLSLYAGTFCEVNTDPLSFFNDKVPGKNAANEIIKQVGPLTVPDILIHSGSLKGVKDPDFLQKTDQFVQWLRQQSKVHKVISITDMILDFKKLENSGSEIPNDLSEIDRIFERINDTQIESFHIYDYITHDFEALRITLMWGLTDTKSSLDQISKIENKANEIGLDIQITGKSALYLRMNDYVVRSFFESAIISAVLITLLIAFSLKSFKMGLLAMCPNVIPISFVLGIMWILNIHIDMGTTIVCSVCLGVAVDDTIHFTYHYFSYLKAGLSNNEALRKVLRTTGKALVLTTGILAIGFSFFMFADFLPNYNFGLLSSVEMILSMVAELFFFPALLMAQKFKKSQFS